MKQASPKSEESAASYNEAIETYSSLRKWVAALGLCVVVSWGVIGMAILQHRVPGATDGHQSNSPASIPAAGAGPWGQLEYLPIVISPPSEYVSETDVDLSGTVVWHFPNVGSAGLSAALREIGLAASLIAKLESMARANVSLPGMSIYPSKALVLGLSSEMRAKLYLKLCEHEQNGDHRNQFLFRGDSPDQWFAGSAVSPEVRKLVEPLIYRHRNFMYFADMRTIASSLSSRNERLALLRVLRREATFLVHIKVSEKSDIEALVRYWSRGGRVQDIRPILESLVQRGGEQSINITHLLPPLARRKLYTYPARSLTDMTIRRDCHWTSLNLFNEIPNDKFSAPSVFASEIKENFYRIHGNLQLGDIAVVLDKKARVLHSATYIADDVFFHRCGGDSSAPWALTKGEDLPDFYPGRGKVTVSYYRRKNM